MGIKESQAPGSHALFSEQPLDSELWQMTVEAADDLWDFVNANFLFR